MDLLIATLKLERLGMLHTSLLLPCLGNDAFAAGDGMCTGLELYGFSAGNSSLYVIQQRAPPAPGMQEQFASSLLQWLQGASAQQVRLQLLATGVASSESTSMTSTGLIISTAQVLLLGSLDAVMRRDLQLSGQQQLHLANGRRLASLCEQLQWPMLKVRLSMSSSAAVAASPMQLASLPCTACCHCLQTSAPMLHLHCLCWFFCNCRTC